MEKAYLNGTLGDYALINQLYRDDREYDALDVLDRVLGIKPDLEASLRHLVAVLLTEDDAKRDRSMSLSRDAEGHTILSVDHEQAPMPNALAHRLLELRCLCFSALAERDPSRAGFAERAIANCELVLNLFPKQPQFVVFASQVAGFLLSTRIQVELLEKAVALGPADRFVRANVERLVAGIQAYLDADPNASDARQFLARGQALLAKTKSH